MSNHQLENCDEVRLIERSSGSVNVCEMIAWLSLFRLILKTLETLDYIGAGINPSHISNIEQGTVVWGKLLLWFTEPGRWAEVPWSRWWGEDSGCSRRKLPFLVSASETHVIKPGWEPGCGTPHKQEIHLNVFIKGLLSRQTAEKHQSNSHFAAWPPPAGRHNGTNTELSIDLKKHIIGLNNPGKSLSAFSKHSQVQSSTAALFVCSFYLFIFHCEGFLIFISSALFSHRF